MDWTDEAYALSLRKFGEADAILEVFARDHGRHLGLVKGGASKSKRADLQPGNRLRVAWKARLADHLGRFDAEASRSFAGLALDDPFALAGIASACAVAAAALPERERHVAVFDAFGVLLDALVGEPHAVAAAVYVRWELGLLADLGFGLDLGRCVVTGSTEDLAFVSPRTGKAVSRAAAAPYEGKLLALPPFLLGAQTGIPTSRDLRDGFGLTGHFFDRSVLVPNGREVPSARAHFADLATR